MATTAEVAVVITAVDSASNILGNIAGAIGNVASMAIDAAAALANLAFDGLQASVQSAMEAEDAVARLEGVLRATGGAVGLTSEQLQDLASNMQEVTRYSDEEIMSAEALMLTFRNVGEDIFPRAIAAAADMAGIFGSLESSTMQLGKALQDPVSMMGALSRAGVTFSEEQKEMIKNFVETGNVAAAQNIILSEVEAQVGGLAETMGETLAGRLVILGNRFDEVKETIGNGFLPVLDRLLTALGASGEGIFTALDNWAQMIVDFVQGPEFTAAVDSIVKLMNDLFNAFYTGDFSAVQQDLRDIWDTIIAPLWDKIQEWVGIAKDKFDAFVAGIFENIETAIDNWVASDGPQRLTDKITGWIDESGLPETLQSKMADAARGMLDSLVIAIGNIEWSAIAAAIDERIARAIRGYDWREAGRAFVDKIVDIFRGSDEPANDDDWMRLIPTLYYLNKFFTDTQSGQALIQGITEWVQGIVQKVKQLLGIASPSSVFAEIGKEIIAGLIQGWTSGFNVLLGIITGDIGRITSAFANSPLGELLNLDGQSIGVQGDASSLLGGTTGTVGGRSTGGATASSGTVNNYYYGPVYFGAAGEPGAYYDCPSPNPILTATASGGTMGGRSMIR